MTVRCVIDVSDCYANFKWIKSRRQTNTHTQTQLSISDKEITNRNVATIDDSTPIVKITPPEQ